MIELIAAEYWNTFLASLSPLSLYYGKPYILERFGDTTGSLLNPNRKWWLVPTIVVTFGVITTMIVYLYKKKKNG
jgi:hypothetical protein